MFRSPSPNIVTALIVHRNSPLIENRQMAPQTKIENSSNHPIRPRQHLRRNRQADLLGCFKINDKLKLSRLLDWKVGGLAPFRILSTYRRDARERARHFGPRTSALPASTIRCPSYITGSRFFTASSIIALVAGDRDYPNHKDRVTRLCLQLEVRSQNRGSDLYSRD